MAVFAATAGDAAGFEAWCAWSAKNECHDEEACHDRWRHYFSSPPTGIGAGSLFDLARQEDRAWQRSSAAVASMFAGVAPVRPRSVSSLAGAEEATQFVRGRLPVDFANLPATADRVRDLLANGGRFFERNGLVKLADDPQHGGLVAKPVTAAGVVNEVHRLVQPWTYSKVKDQTIEKDITLPDRVAQLYLDKHCEWGLPVLHGITSAPLPTADGGIHAHDGYDPVSGQWCHGVPDVSGMVPDRPTHVEALGALRTLREMFCTFPFADAERVWDASIEAHIGDLSKPPSMDESGFLAGLLTAVCRASLHLAPGLLLHAPAVSGSGTGKGKLARSICIVAFGREPAAFTVGADRVELEKRIVSALIDAASAMFLDNVNGLALKSDLLASVLTERPSKTRILGKSSMVSLSATASVVVTGNGLSVSEDLARRFVVVELNARMENPDRRKFRGDILAQVSQHRAELLTACLMIWRWGRQNASVLRRGHPIGTYETWAEWVRDPLLSLGCADPAERISEVKANDQYRKHIAALFTTWYSEHGDAPVTAAGLCPAARAIIDPQGRGRQYVVSKLDKLIDTRVGGWVLTAQPPAGKWGKTTYAVRSTGADGTDPIGHRGHRPPDPMPPVAPMPPMPLVRLKGPTRRSPWTI